MILARLLLNDQQQLNVVFDYDSLPDVLVILMSNSFCFTNVALSVTHSSVKLLNHCLSVDMAKNVVKTLG